MNLSDYITEVTGKRLAEQLGCSDKLVSHWRTGRQRPSPKFARRLEALSNGRVKAADLRPDIYGEEAA